MCYPDPQCLELAYAMKIGMPLLTINGTKYGSGFTAMKEVAERGIPNITLKVFYPEA